LRPLRGHGMIALQRVSRTSRTLQPLGTELDCARIAQIMTWSGVTGRLAHCA
jgi:hypothetical protein